MEYNIIEFKQIVGRGTRLYYRKTFFTIYDFVNDYAQFNDTEWDGEPSEPEGGGGGPGGGKPGGSKGGDEGGDAGGEQPRKIRIKLRDGQEREIKYIMTTSFWGQTGSL